MRIILLLPALLYSFVAHTQAIRTAVSSVYYKLTAYSNRFTDAFSFGANQAALAANQKFSAGVYSEKRFLLSALSTYSAALVIPSSLGNFGLKGDYFGQQAFNESSAGVAYARNLGSKVAVGVQFNYFAIKAAGYGSATSVNFDAGAIFHLTPLINAGLHVYNPVGTTWGKDREKLPAIYTAGFGYDASEQVFIGVEAEKMEGEPININAGLQYKFAENLLSRAGIRSATSVYYLGIGVQIKKLRLDVTGSVHPYLGVTPGLLLLYSQKE